MEFIALFLATFGVALSMIINEVKLNLSIDEANENYLLIYVAFSSLVLAASHFYRYQLYLKMEMYRGLLTEYDTLIST